eukprot:555972-Pelagomonas_calceolata.AAC.3
MFFLAEWPWQLCPPARCTTGGWEGSSEKQASSKRLTASLAPCLTCWVRSSVWKKGLTPLRTLLYQVSITTPKEPKSATLARPVVSPHRP